MPSSLSMRQPAAETKPRDVKAVPFVELHESRLQGVVSSGSDIRRVYVSYFESDGLAYYCSTNNNRPCGGLRGAPCKHLQSLLAEAVKQYSLPEVIRFLGLPADRTQSLRDIIAQASGVSRNPAGEVFARFLAYLQLLEHPDSRNPLPEMEWFVE